MRSTPGSPHSGTFISECGPLSGLGSRRTTKADVDEIVGITDGLGPLLRFCLPSPTRSIAELLYYPFRSIQSRSTSLAKVAKPIPSLIGKF